MSFIRRIKKGGKVYLAEVENKRINGKIIQKHIRYVGKEVDGKTIISTNIEDIQVKEVKVHGPLIVLNHLANKVGLPEILGDYSNEILSMVYAHCLNYKSVNNMPEWFSRTDLNTILNLEGLTESRLLGAMDTINEDSVDFLQAKIFDNIKEVYSLSSRGVVYDVTNTYLYGKKCPFGKLGKSKEGKRDKPLIQIGLAITQKEGIPITHKVFDGNIHDSKTLSSIIDALSDCKIRPGLFVYDRGITSGKNIKEVKKLGWNTLCGIPINTREKMIVRRILKNGPISTISNRVVVNKKNFYIKSINHTIEGIGGKLAICYNEQKKVEIKSSRYDEIVNAQGLLSKRKTIKSGLQKYLTPTGRIRQPLLDAAEEFDGYSCIFCTKNIPNEDMINLYFDKDVVEKAFRTLKGITNLQPIRHWLYNRVIAHIFICYLSCLLLSLLKLEVKKLKVSPVTALKELESMYRVYLYDKKKNHEFVKSVTMSKSQEKILRLIDKRLLRQS